MSPQIYGLLADLILLIHFGVVLFNLFWLAAVPLGARLEWRFVRIRWLRITHLISMALVAVQPLLGRVCLLTIWQYAFDEKKGDVVSIFPAVRAWVISLMYWQAPPWAFAVMYVAAFAYTIALWKWVPPQPKAAKSPA